jgi:hypothetical protein
VLAERLAAPDWAEGLAAGPADAGRAAPAAVWWPDWQPRL